MYDIMLLKALSYVSGSNVWTKKNASTIKY